MIKENRIYKTHGVVIAESNSGDYDKVLTILTAKHGKIVAFAKGSRRQKSNLLASTQIFAFSEFVIYQSTSMAYVNSAELIDIFYDIRDDYEKLYMAFNICKIIFSTVEEGEPAPEILSLVVSTLNALSKTSKDPEFIFTIFKAKLLFYLGYGFVLNNRIKDVSKKDIEKEDEENKILFSILNGKEARIEKVNKEILNKENISLEFYDLAKEELQKEKDIIKNQIKNTGQINIKNITPYKSGMEFLRRDKYILNKNIFDIFKYIYTKKDIKIFNIKVSEKQKFEISFLTNKLYENYIGIEI